MKEKLDIFFYYITYNAKKRKFSRVQVIFLTSNARGEKELFYTRTWASKVEEILNVQSSEKVLTLSLLHQHLEVTPIQWSGMNVKEREKHLAKLGTSVVEEMQQENKESLGYQEVIGKFENSGLPEFFKGS